MNPPTNSHLIEIISNMIETHSNYNSLEEEKAFKRLAVHMKRHTPDKSWMLQLLAVMDETHEVF